MSAITRKAKKAARQAASQEPERLSYQERQRRRYGFRLTLRLDRAPHQDPNLGFDGYFLGEYMGAAEYEWGIIPESLYAIRAEGGCVVRSVEIGWAGLVRTVWFVGPMATLDEKIIGFREWLADGARCKEASYFPEAFGGHLPEYHQDCVAWWALGADVMWALDEMTARDLLAAINAKATR